MPLWAAAVFELTLKIDGVKVDTFGEISLVREISNDGKSGCSTSQLTVAVPDDVSASRAAPVILSGAVNLPTFYVSNRQKGGGKIVFTCLDRMAFTDEEIAGVEVKDGKVKTAAVLQSMADVCGLPPSINFSVPGWLTDIPAEKIEGISFSQFLEEISEVVCGAWYINSTDELSFLPFGESADFMSIDDHTALIYGDERTYTGVMVRNGSNVFVRGDTTYAYDTIQIDSDLGCDDAAKEIWNRIRNKSFFAVDCTQAIINDIPDICPSVEFAQGGTFRIPSVRISISSGGMVASFTASGAEGSEIGHRSKLSKTLDSKVAMNKKAGCMMFTPYQGIILVDGEEIINSG